MLFDVNTSEVVKFTEKLNKMHRSLFPNAVRNTLNKAGFDVKQNTLHKSTDKNFEKRQPNFFKANSRVEMAKGFNIGQMKATVGMTSHGLKGANNYAVKDLEQQEHGGKIGGRSFVPLKEARGGNNSRPVRPGNRMSAIDKVLHSRNVKAKTPEERFIKGALRVGIGGHLIHNKYLFRINKIYSSLKKRQTIVKATPLYKYRKNGSVKVKSTGFMKEASLNTASKLNWFYQQEAVKQLNKIR